MGKVEIALLKKVSKRVIKTTAKIHRIGKIGDGERVVSYLGNQMWESECLFVILWVGWVGMYISFLFGRLCSFFVWRVNVLLFMRLEVRWMIYNPKICLLKLIILHFIPISLFQSRIIPSP